MWKGGGDNGTRGKTSSYILQEKGKQTKRRKKDEIRIEEISIGKERAEKERVQREGERTERGGKVSVGGEKKEVIAGGVIVRGGRAGGKEKEE